jgi:hypothetical protein
MDFGGHPRTPGMGLAAPFTPADVGSLKPAPTFAVIDANLRSAGGYPL